MKRVILTLFILVSTIFSDEVDSMRDKVNRIETNIRKNEQNINSAIIEERNLLKQIDSITNELNLIKQNFYETEREYQKINRSINYAEQNLKIVDQEILDATLHFEKIIYSYNEYIYLNKSNLIFQEYDINNYFESEEMKEILGDSYSTIENISSIKSEIRKKRDEIASERKELASLRRDLANKKVAIERKQREQTNLIRRLRNNQTYYREQITKLQREKLDVERQIENIIKERARITGEYNTEIIIRELGFSIMPSDGEIIFNFGQEKSPEIYASAMEIKSTLGDRIKASNRGEVIFVGRLNNLGNVIMISHGYNLTTVYGNLISSYVSVGDVVRKGQIIGVLGFSTRREPVLYFETRLGTQSVDPKIFFEK